MRPRNIYLRFAGWMTILAGVLVLINGLQPILGTAIPGLDFEIDRYFLCGILILGLGIMAIIGGISALRGKSTILALAGAACAAVGDGLAGAILGLASVVLIFLSHEDL